MKQIEEFSIYFCRIEKLKLAIVVIIFYNIEKSLLLKCHAKWHFKHFEGFKKGFMTSIGLITIYDETSNI